jgi:hypothetical protein
VARPHSARCSPKNTGNIILIISAIGDMEIEIERWIKFTDEADRCLHLGAVCFQIIPVQVQVFAPLCASPATVGRAGWGSCRRKQSGRDLSSIVILTIEHLQ